MTPPTKNAVFLGRVSYRQRRLRDAVRMLPVIGTVLWIFPLLAGQGGLTSRIGLFIFGVWVLLIVVSAILTTRMTPDTDPDDASRDVID